MSAGLYRTDVRTALEANGWREDDVEGYMVAPSGAVWAETNEALDSGLDSPCGTWTVAFDSGVPACVIVGAALAVAGSPSTGPAAAYREVADALEDRACDADHTEHPRYIVGLREGAEIANRMADKAERGGPDA